MKRTNRPRKLRLHRETLRRLAADDLERVAGGAASNGETTQSGTGICCPGAGYWMPLAIRPIKPL